MNAFILLATRMRGARVLSKRREHGLKTGVRRTRYTESNELDNDAVHTIIGQHPEIGTLYRIDRRNVYTYYIMEGDTERGASKEEYDAVSV